MSWFASSGAHGAVHARLSELEDGTCRNPDHRVAGDSYQTVVNDLANRLTEAAERIAELEEDLSLANKATLELVKRGADLTNAILDIDAHATPLAQDEDGFAAGGYIVSVGAIHRALGVLGRSAGKCPTCEPSTHDCETPF